MEGRPPTAGYDHVSCRLTVLDDGTKFRDNELPTGAIVHADRDPRRPPYRPIFLVRNGDEKRFAWCGAQIKIVLPGLFDVEAPRACPDCVQALGSPAELRWRSG